MFLVSSLRYALSLLVPLSFLLTTYLYLYPVFNGCAFPSAFPDESAASALLNTLREHTSSPAHNASWKAPFRLLALGDPQLEGDTSIPDSETASFPHLKKFWKDALLRDGVKHGVLERIRHSLHDLVDFYFLDIPNTLNGYRKRLDLIGNDYYLAHIYRTLYWWTKPTHVTVLGDLVGSQWIEDDEFNLRGLRFWNGVFKNAQRVPDELTADHEDWDDVPSLSDNAETWQRRIINVAGNHDIGYAGDLTPERFERFEKVFGRANYELRFQLKSQLGLYNSTPIEPSDGSLEPDIPELRIVVLNDMNLDMPASSKDLQDDTYKFINNIITTSHPVTRQALFTLVLTHIPLYKEAGICVDGPFFDFHDLEIFAQGIKEQNHLTSDASKGILEGIFGKNGNAFVDGQGLGRNGVVLTGHDHEGCDVYHYINQSLPEEERAWQARRWHDAKRDNLLNQAGIPGIREITVRSMMGEFGGNAGLLSLWFDPKSWEWKFEFDTCMLGVQHWWWAIHILDLITVGASMVFLALVAAQSFGVLNPSAASKPSITAKSATRKAARSDPAAVTSKLVGGGKGTVDGLLDGTTALSQGKRSLKKKRSKRGLNGTPEPENESARRPLSSVFET